MAIGAAGSDDDPTDRTTVRDRIEELLEGSIETLTVTHRSGETVYLVASRLTTMEHIDSAPDMEIPIMDLRTVVVDLETERVTVSDNGLWLPEDAEIGDAMVRSMARTTTATNRPIDGTLEQSATEAVEIEILLDREIRDPSDHDEEHKQNVARMKREPGIDPKRDWGYFGGPPPEIEIVVDRLQEAGLETDRFIRLEFGKKSPIERMNGDLSNGRSADELYGNYGISMEAEPEGLLLIDVDDAEALPEDVDLPETFEVSSPHGDESQVHKFYRCAEKDLIADELGSWVAQPAWGDLWVGDRYAVGLGSQIGEYGCTAGDHVNGDLGGCEVCKDESRGYYRLANDAPIATIDAETVLDLVPDGFGSTETIEPDEDEAEPVLEEVPEDHVECDSCGAVIHEDEAKTFEVGGVARSICRGGCE